MRLQAQTVSFAYHADQPALHEVSLEVAAGEVLFILGRNGSGKTTLMACLSGIRRPHAGAILLEGRPLTSYSATERARRIGLIPQVHVPAFPYSVFEMILMGRTPHLGLLGQPGREDRRIAEEALQRVGLADLRDRPYTELSGGERQLVMIARGLAQQCRILLMDEPDAHLDPRNQHQVMQTVAQLAHQGLSFVIASHAPNNALLYAHRVLLMRKGKALACGAPQETLTPALLGAAYGMILETVTETQDGQTITRAILPSRLNDA